jgi:cytochrome c oxidase cbb3-type subunit I/II
MAAAMLYWMVPRLYGTKLASQRLANVHFYIGTIGILLYVVSMWVSGVTQGLMWRAETAEGGLMYPNFIETIDAIRPMYWTRLVGGTMYFVGFIIQAYNLIATVRQADAKPVTSTVEVVREAEPEGEPSWVEVVFSWPIGLSVAVFAICAGIAFVNELASTVLIAAAFAVAIFGTMGLMAAMKRNNSNWHAFLEGKALIFTVLTTVSVAIGGAVEIIPTIVTSTAERVDSPMQPYTALELSGRDLYVAEGCYNCHSQMIRPFTWESSRYGQVSSLNDSVWDFPFQWGSKRTGPDLAREGNRYPHLWHYNHMLDPRSTSPGSIMPAYPHLRTTRVDFGSLETRLSAMRTLGVPYEDSEIRNAETHARAEAREIAEELREQVELDGSASEVPLEDSQLVAMIAYLQRLGLNEPNFRPADGGEDAPVQVSEVTPPVQEASR